ncbi:malate dehydrogenase [Candidatus Comchoanobacter bicostacola]|uniref:Malate dehydrogenase n=1 Tax=Candidatus Comchoanobacter bicostacola TaxID=2919598 RepID=A0ABY5DIS2_9GAMM|nr:malate dehydrogenase [Candidatus Comchoanobacter bicostacola]UTC24170.1 malate dehydrogenase [Candidatus Comchoanobacter bicostacola]
MKKVSVALTGAGGQIAYHLIYSISKGEVFGFDTQVDLRLVDIPEVLPKIEGLVMELEDSRLTLLSSVSIHSDQQLDQAFQSIDFAFLVGAFPRLAGMERKDLLEKNGLIFKTQGEALGAYAKPSVQTLVVGNPCNTNCLIALSHAKNIPSNQFYAMTLLDEFRASYQLAKMCQVPVVDITDLYIYGNHSATQFPDFTNARVKDQPIISVLDQSGLETTFVPMIQQRGAAVIKARGSSSAASAARSAAETAHKIWSQSSTPFSVAVVSSGCYDAPDGIVVSAPYYFKDGKGRVYDRFDHDATAKAMIEKSYQELLQEREAVIALGFLDE